MGCHLSFKWRKFGLSHPEPVKFGVSQWQKRHERLDLLYIVYRLLVVLYFWGFLVWNIVWDMSDDVRPYYMLYLTNWSYLTAVFDTAVQLVSAVATAYRFHNGIQPVMPDFLYKLHWSVVNISHTMEPVVTALYWTSIYPQLGVGVTYSDLHLHLLTTLYTLLDLMVHGTPRRFHHVTFPLLFGLTYLTFTGIYYACGGLNPKGGTDIYPILDWQKPGMTVGVAFGAVAATSVVHALTWGLVKLRVSLHARLFGKRLSVDVDFEERAAGGGPPGGGAAGGTAGAADADPQEELDVTVDVGDGKGGGGARPRPSAPPAPSEDVGAEKGYENKAASFEDDCGDGSGQTRIQRA